MGVSKIGINGDRWLDPRSIKLGLRHNEYNNTTDLQIPEFTLGLCRNKFGPGSAVAWTCFRNMYVVAGRQIIGDIDYDNRVHQMRDLLTPFQKGEQTQWLQDLADIRKLVEIMECTEVRQNM